MPEPRTGYYAASRDWPAIPCPIPLEETYRALEGITDEDVDAAMDSLAGVGERQASSSREDRRALPGHLNGE